ncbi:glycosyltransferase [Cyanobium sp. Cruz CV13-4-11]|jgi:glycosyltransferase involved in cell wall biosynthesis|uniref:glycosyltransferase n=1 Tax=unclassified Cyanobium TaxID=2627006 RepID=UPI0020CD7918|nr:MULTISPECIES: glycosyltransferase [unclassified Cyanobium]MCP9900247.1 glycosyltransferase [Cyanobium sp. Cruz CV11-17]MCP9918560.1 glycosyltransferase [Cyanobium sp. Cruz CV13-4-11]
MTLSVAIPTYGRDQVLVDSVAALLALDPPPFELLVVDQTPRHDPDCEARLGAWQAEGRIKWLRLPAPSITGAMNVALQEARGERVLFLDDDILPDPELLNAHERAGGADPNAMLAGRVLQPWHQGQSDPEDGPFLFNSLRPRSVEEFMGGNVAIPRRLALELGGFDQNFVRVAYRFEAEFAFRWRQAGHPIQYVPGALIHHLRAERGGTRSYGKHLTTVKPDHAVGRYYFQLRTQPLPAALAGCLRGWLGSVRSRHHLRHPWWIPPTLVAEGRGLLWALRLQRKGPALLPTRRSRLLIAGSHPIQYQTPLFQALSTAPGVRSDVLYLTLPDARTQGLGFGVSFEWDVPLLEGYAWHEATSGRGRGITSGYRGVWLARPLGELGFGPGRERPDALLLTGWHFLGMVQLFSAARLQGLPVLLRMDSNAFRPRPWPLTLAYWFLFRGVSVGLPVGTANARWYRQFGVPQKRLVPSPHFVDNAYFSERAGALRPRREELRQRWSIPREAFCFLFAGKLQPKKRPFDLLEALRLLLVDPLAPPVHLLLVGTGPLEEGCRALAAQHRLPVSFAGFLNQSEMPSAYAVADSLVLPSDHGETWGLVVNEAMACGLPAIVSDQVGCAEDLVIEGRTGLVSPVGQPAALAAALGRMAADPAAAARMGAAAKELVQDHFSVRNAAEGILAGLALLEQR